MPVLERGEDLLREVQPVARDLRELAPDMTRTSQGLSPIAREAAKNINSVLEFVKRWALTTNGRDGLTHYFRAHLEATPLMATHTVPVPLGGGSPAGIFGNDPAEDSAQPDPNKDVPQIPGMLDPKPSRDGGVTGLKKEQESGALGFMLGGGK